MDSSFYENRDVSNTPTPKISDKPTLHEILIAEKLDFEAKVQRATRRKKWLKGKLQRMMYACFLVSVFWVTEREFLYWFLQNVRCVTEFPTAVTASVWLESFDEYSGTCTLTRFRFPVANETLLRTLLSYCSLHGASGGGLASVRMELVLLLQELQQEKTQQQLLSPLPFPTTLPLLSASVACNKTVVTDPVRFLQVIIDWYLKFSLLDWQPAAYNHDRGKSCLFPVSHSRYTANNSEDEKSAHVQSCELVRVVRPSRSGGSSVFVYLSVVVRQWSDWHK